tara:strand:- start:4081 stop:6321 length:2241 start_codon:yes stop_codon:yes gene_type:complete
MEIYINNIKFEASDDETIIQVADRHDIHIPRFCYHKRLSIVASCRMCLVEVEGAKYPQPACSTLVRDGMKINTSGTITEEAQKSTMEFLLINHPLDCPVCDQAGECELQDVSLEHGDYKSSYSEIKRTVIDKDIGKLISTEMTRCIHCSRCVRFGEEVAGIKELGMTGRGENTKIETFINESISSELSGNVIDLCPVGALNNNLYKYSARTWDLKQVTSLSPNDCLGSNINYHTYNNKIKRCVPRENDEVNLSWLSDSDRFGHEGIDSEERILNPYIRIDGKLQKTDFKTIYNLFSEKIKMYASKSTAFMSAQSTSEEMYLFQKILRENNIYKIDHRVKECDFKYQSKYPVIPSFDCKLNDILSMDNIILVNINVSKEFPILSIYLRNAIKNNATKIFSLSTYNYDENFDIDYLEVLNPVDIEYFLNNSKANFLNKIDPKKRNLVVMGPSVSYFKNYTNTVHNLSVFAKSINSKLSLLGDQCNTSGAWAMGIVPHRYPGGEEIDRHDKRLLSSENQNEDLLIIYNLEPEYDFSNDNNIIERLKNSKCNIFFSSYITDSIEKYADIIFPLAVQQESSGSYINTNKKLQRFQKVLVPRGDSKAGVDLLLDISKSLGMDLDKEMISEEISSILSNINVKNNFIIMNKIDDTEKSHNLEKLILRSPNSNNPTLRRCTSLLETHDNDNFLSIPMNKSLADNKKIILTENKDKIKLSTPTKQHEKPSNTILIKMSGRYKQKIGACNTSVEID